MVKKHLIWFRNDLRIQDNPAFTKACEDSEAIVSALFIITPLQWQKHDMSARQAQFVYDNLLELHKSLASLNITLHIIQCPDFIDTINVIDQFCQEQQINNLYYNRQYEYNERKRDWLIKQKLQSSVDTYEFDGNLFLTPLTVRNGQGEMYKVFTPFRQAFLDRFLQSNPGLYNTPSSRPHQHATISSIPSFDYPMQPYDFFNAGEDKAITHLERFCEERVIDYADKRDIPSIDYTSQISAYLALGVLSVRQCFYFLNKEHPEFWLYKESGAFCWFNELVWREFYQHLMVAHSRLCRHKPFIEWTDNIKWKNDSHQFEQWKTGNTGYPIVDAAMRQLNQTGWMHNRLRMITASFLVKDLLIDWRWGEQYFMSQLTDGDLAANNGGWQWAASTGTDSVPYFRIFNPTTQGKRFDPDGSFIKQWLPELTKVPEKFIHTPHLWAKKMEKVIHYPQPIVIHEIARRETLEAFEIAKNNT